jgi:hypothetical protein
LIGARYQPISAKPDIGELSDIDGGVAIRPTLAAVSRMTEISDKKERQ